MCLLKSQCSLQQKALPTCVAPPLTVTMVMCIKSVGSTICRHSLWWAVQTIQNADVAWRPIGLIAYLIMGWAATFLAYNWVDSARIGLAIYGVFDFTSTFM